MLVRGSEGTGWALLGKGKGSEAGSEMVQRGCEVRVRKPVWEVELLAERWVVGVEWEVCEEGMRND